MNIHVFGAADNAEDKFEQTIKKLKFPRGKYGEKQVNMVHE